VNNQQHSRLCGSNSVSSLFACHDAILAGKASSGHTLGACPFGRHFIEESFILANPGHPSELPYQLQPLEILIRPMRLELDHRPQRLYFKCLAWPVKRNRHPPPVGMEVELMRARLTVQDKAVSGEGRDQLASRQAAQV
jgi:hypothetical protein